MPKRYTDTDKWKKPFIRSLEAPYKLLWFYILDDCDHAGIWHVDFEVAEIRTGCKFSKDEAIEIFAGRIEILGKGDKWFLRDFISFQYGTLNEKNKVHSSVINILKKYNIDTNKDLGSPLEGAKDKVKEKDKEQDKDKDKDKVKDNSLNGGVGENFLIQKMFAVFKKHNPTYPESKELDFKPLLKIAAFLCETGKLRGGPELHADRILEAWEPISQTVAKDKFYKQKTLTTISNHIQEITQNALYGDPKDNGRTEYGSKERAAEYDRRINERYSGGGSTTG